MNADSTITKVDGCRHPNFSGIWVANLARSKFLEPTPKSLIARITHVADELRQELRLTKPDGTEERATFRTRTDVQQSQALLNDNPIRSNVRWNGQELAIETWLQSGTREMHFYD